MLSFLKEHFFKYYKFDINSSKIFYTSGRNEFRSKGLDLYIKSLSQLNAKLKKKNSSQNVINLFLIPIGDFKRIENLSNLKDNPDKLWDFAPLSTHEVPMNNEIIKTLMDNNLLNNKDDNVKVLVIPIYLNNDDGVLNMDYYDAISGLDLGIFPSYYEPWGYTPLESIAFGVPTITTDFAGFGRAVLKDFNESHIGVRIIKRENIEFNTSSNEMTDYFYNFLNKMSTDIEHEKKDAHAFSRKFSWSRFIENYIKAYNIAKNRK